MKFLTILAIVAAALALTGCDPKPEPEATTNAASSTIANDSAKPSIPTETAR